MIYFIQDTKSRAIKIGTSRNPVARLKELQTAHAHPLVLLAVMDGGVVEERELHQKFARLHGEWFEPTPELNVFVREYAMRMPQGVRMERRSPPPREPLTPPVATEPITAMDLSTWKYGKRDIWAIAIVALQEKDGDYKYSSPKIAKFMTTKGTAAHREEMYADVERVVFTIRSMSEVDIDRLLRNAPPEQIEFRRKYGITEEYNPDYP